MTRREATAVLLSPLLAGALPRSPKVLLVVAHPDDEYYFAATVYRIAQELQGTVDQVVITNGEGGYRYSLLAERIYGVRLTDEVTGRSRLPEIRKRETLAAGKILGIRHHHFLDQRDQRFTLDADEADQIWDRTNVRKRLTELITEERYDFVFTMLPRSTTHGHHQTATLLALEAVQGLESSRRPVVFGAEPRQAGEREEFPGLAGHPLTVPIRSTPEFAFNRRQTFGYQNALSYDVVVNWVIAEHKSQGMFQNDVHKHDVELFWRFGTGPDDAETRVAAFLHHLQPHPNEWVPKVNHP